MYDMIACGDVVMIITPELGVNLIGLVHARPVIACCLQFEPSKYQVLLK
jgi:hypothetical protein